MNLKQRNLKTMHPFLEKNTFRRLTDNWAQKAHKMITECFTKLLETTIQLAKNLLGPDKNPYLDQKKNPERAKLGPDKKKKKKKRAHIHICTHIFLSIYLSTFLPIYLSISHCSLVYDMLQAAPQAISVKARSNTVTISEADEGWAIPRLHDWCLSVATFVCWRTALLDITSSMQTYHHVFPSIYDPTESVDTKKDICWRLDYTQTLCRTYLGICSGLDFTHYRLDMILRVDGKRQRITKQKHLGALSPDWAGKSCLILKAHQSALPNIVTYQLHLPPNADNGAPKALK